MGTTADPEGQGAGFVPSSGLTPGGALGAAEPPPAAAGSPPTPVHFMYADQDGILRWREGYLVWMWSGDSTGGAVPWHDVLGYREG